MGDLMKSWDMCKIVGKDKLLNIYLKKMESRDMVN